MEARLLLDDSAYVLSRAQDGAWVEMARLPGGPQALMPGTRPLDEGQFEAAIQRAEDWLAPHLVQLRGAALDVVDPSGHFEDGLQAVLQSNRGSWDVDALERAFIDVVDLATGRAPPAALGTQRAFVADLLLLRELAHHARLSEIRCR